jgi:hypothetical protein
MPRKAVLLAIFTLGNAACALAPSYGWRSEECYFAGFTTWRSNL